MAQVNSYQAPKISVLLSADFAPLPLKMFVLEIWLLAPQHLVTANNEVKMSEEGQLVVHSTNITL